jgi:hypothetical protein
MRPDGSIIQPPMPWPNYTQMSDEDVYAVAVYLKCIPAVAHKVPDRVPPDQKVAGAVIVIPPPAPWDASRTPPQAALPAAERGK